MADEVLLTYFDGRGLGEIIRITLSFANISVGMIIFSTPLIYYFNCTPRKDLTLNNHPGWDCITREHFTIYNITSEICQC